MQQDSAEESHVTKATAMDSVAGDVAASHNGVGGEQMAAEMLESEFGGAMRSSGELKETMPKDTREGTRNSARPQNNGSSDTSSQHQISSPPPAVGRAEARTASTSAGENGVHDVGELAQAAFTKLGNKAWNPGSVLTEDQLEAISNLGELVTRRPFSVDEWNAEVEQEVEEQEQDRDEDGGKEARKQIGAVASLYLELAAAAGHTDGMDEEVADVYESYRKLVGILELCDLILHDLVKVDGVLAGLRGQHEEVVHKTSTLHSECEQLLAEKVELEGLAKSIQKRLAYYDELDELQRQLTLPTFHTGSAAFMPLLCKADEAIAHLSSHAHFADTSAYLNRFRQVQTRALAVVKAEVASSLQRATEQVQAQMKEAAAQGQHLENSVVDAQYQAAGENIPKLMQEVASRASWSWVYKGVLTECQHVFFQQRLRLLAPSVSALIAAAVAQHSLANAIREGCVALCDVCHREYNLFKRFFPILEGQVPLETLVEPFCTQLVDAVRPLYLQTLSVDTLCSLAAVLKGEILEGQVELRGASLAAMRPCIATLLHEVQERLTFRTTILIRDEIRGYTPSKDDTDYPNKLQSSASSKHGGVDGGSSWYPVLARTLSVLAQLYRTVDKKIFEGLAQDAVSACTEALLHASKEVERGRGRADGMLFLVMHLLKLREQIVPFDIDFSSTEMQLDFTDTRSALSRLVSSRNAILALSSDNSVLGLARAAPRVQQTQRNTKKELERELKHACEALIQLLASQIVDPLASWVNKADGLSHSSANASLRAHAFAAPDKVKELMAGLDAAVSSFNQTHLPKMQLYLPNPQTRGVLLTPIRSSVAEAYARLHAYVLAEYTPEEYLAMKVLSPQDLAAMMQRQPPTDAGQRANAAGEATLELSGGSWKEPKAERGVSDAGEGSVMVQDLQGGAGGGGGEEEKRRVEEEERKVREAAEEERRMQAELERAQAEEERRREEERREEEETRLAQEEEERRRRVQEEEEERKRVEAEEEERRARDEERRREEEEAMAQEERRREEEERQRQAEAARLAEEEEEERRAQEEEEKKRAQEEEEKKRAQEEEERRKAQEEEERRRAEEEAAAAEKQRMEEETRRKEEERAREEEKERKRREAEAAAAQQGGDDDDSDDEWGGTVTVAHDGNETAAVATAAGREDGGVKGGDVGPAAEQTQPKSQAAAAGPAKGGGGGGQVFGGGQLPPGFVFEDGELKYVGK